MRTVSRRGVLRAGAAGLGLAAAGRRAAAQAGPPPASSPAWPSGTITLIVPFAAGGATDVVSRVVAKALSERIGRTIVVENLGGAGGITGAQRLIRSAPDGSALLMGTVATHAIVPLMNKQPPYDPGRDFAPISLCAIVPNVLLVNQKVPARNVADLVALLKADPGKYSYGSSGVGTPLHLSGELFKSLAGVSMEHVPYRGGGPAMVDLLAGNIPIMFDVLSGAAGTIRAGSVRALAVTTKERSPAFPDVPTIAESGLPGYETYTWNAVFGPAGMAPALVARFADELRAVVADGEVRTRLAELSAVPVGSTPGELAAQVATENAKWAPIVQAAGLRT